MKDAVGAVVMYPPFNSEETGKPVGNMRKGFIVFTNGQGFTFFVKRGETKDGKLKFTGYASAPRKNKDDRPEGVFYVNIYENRQDNSAVLTLFLKTIPTIDDEQSKTVFVANLFRGCLGGMTEGGLFKFEGDSEQEEKPKKSSKSSDVYEMIY